MTAKTLNCRETPGTNAAVVAVLPYGATYKPMVILDGWAKIVPAPGADTCWVFEGWTEIK